VATAFEFVGNDFITVRNEDQSTTTFSAAQLTGATMALNAPLLLSVNTGTGGLAIGNISATAVDIDSYEITSPSGSLSPANWARLSNTIGGGWQTAGVVDATRLAEINPIGSLTLNSGQTVNLGPAFSPFVGITDLTFAYTTAAGAKLTGIVNYIGGGGGAGSSTPEPTNILAALIATSARFAVRRNDKKSRPEQRRAVPGGSVRHSRAN